MVATKLFTGAGSKILPQYSRIQIPNRANFQKVMASPPTTTFTTAHTIASPLHWPAGSSDGNFTALGSSYFSYTGTGNIQNTGTTYPNNLFVNGGSVNYGNFFDSNITRISFVHYGSAIEFFVKGSTGAFAVKIDDQYISLTPQAVPNDGNFYYYYIPFGSAATRRIDIVAQGALKFGGVYTAATDMIAPAPIRGPRVMILGDSYTEGTGSTMPFCFAQDFADLMGWDDVWPSGVGSTGYLATVGQKITPRARFSTDVTPFAPEVVIYALGINDTASASALGTEAAALYAACSAALPKTLQIALPAFTPYGPGSTVAIKYAQNAAIKSAIQAAGGMFVDIYSQKLPSWYSPQVQTLAAAASAGATTISLPSWPVVRGTYQFADGTRFQVVSAAISGGPYVTTVDAGLVNAQASGATVTQIGDSYLTGAGRVGATTGYGSADVFTSADATHPSPAGHMALANVLAAQLMTALGPN